MMKLHFLLRKRRIQKKMKYDGKISYTEFFAFNKTVGKDINNLEDSDCCSRMLRE